MHCGIRGTEDDDDIISSSSGSFSSNFSSSPPSGDHRRGTKDRSSLHSPLSSIASYSSTDSSHHSPAGSNSSPPCGYLIRELDPPPSGLNLLVAALDVQDPRSFDHHAQSHSLLIEDHRVTSPEDKRNESSISDSSKVGSYLEKRRKNNEAAKRSREKRRISDMAMEARLMELSRENSLLKHELDSVNKRRPIATPTPTVLTPSPIVAPTPPTVSRSTPDHGSHYAGAFSPHQQSVSIASPAASVAAHFASLQTVPRSSFLPTAAGLANAGLVNPLLAMIPPAMLLQAAMAQQQQQQQHHHHQQQQQHQRPLPSPPVTVNTAAAANMKRFGSFSASDGSLLSTIQHSSFLGSMDQGLQPPTVPSMLSAALSTPASPGPQQPTASSFLDGKQYLRYKLLERQLQQQSTGVGGGGGFATPSSHGLNMLGSVISNGANGLKQQPPQQQPQQQQPRSSTIQPPPAKRQRTSTNTASKPNPAADLIRADADTSLSLKECLSSLAVSLISPGALPNGEKATIGCDTTSPTNTATSSSISRTSVHSSPVIADDAHLHHHPQPDPARSLHSAIFDDGYPGLGDLLRARTHSDSSQSSAGISSHGSSTSTSVSVIAGTAGGNCIGGGHGGALSPGSMMEMEFRQSFADRRRDSNASDSGIASDGASDRRMSASSASGGGGGKRYRTDHERYVERRRRNNEAAKRCRANRRAMFEYRYQRAQELENENSRLKDEMRQLSRELTELKEMITKRGGSVGESLSTSNDYVLQALDKNRELEMLENAARLKNLLNAAANTADLVLDVDDDDDDDDEENRESKLSIVDEIKEDDRDEVDDDTDPDEEIDVRDCAPLDFTLKKEKV